MPVGHIKVLTTQQEFSSKYELIIEVKYNNKFQSRTKNIDVKNIFDCNGIIHKDKVQEFIDESLKDWSSKTD